jgi:uncharacterized protein YbjT (DUF2867 family)
MKVLILGATGKTGRLVLERAVDAGHEVTVLVRNRAGLPVIDGVEELQGDATSAADITRAVAGQQGILNVLGSRKPRKPVEAVSTALLVPAAIEAGATRLIVCSAYGVGETYGQAPWPARIIFRTLLGRVYAAKEAADATVKGSSLDWTLVYPTRLTGDSPRGEFQQVERLIPKGLPTISRADVAQFMVEQLVDPTWSRRTVILANS